MLYQQSPTVVEQASLAELEAKYEQCLVSIKSFLVGHSSSPENLSQFMSWLDQQAQVFIRFTPQSEWLKNRTFSQVAHRLDFVLRDLSAAKASAADMYRQKIDTRW